MFNYDLGGNTVEVQVSEAMADIAHNKTLFIHKLTSQDPIRPQAVNLQSASEVFDHFQPNVDVEFEKPDGSSLTENLKFTNVGAFSVKNIINDSLYLKNVNLQHEAYLKVLKQLKTNKALKTVIDNPQTKEAFVNALRALAAELEEEN